ncbi:hypothetical protein [Herbaspirillum sp. RV1423]|uniref:hypothetical protein n=1 Tax=Herbaspirillum sp. RV1423 TaxID=1443993 RepID=UPI0004B77ADC|nr:hypothetical protein [Herbaspirillum sp. RV1423]
MNHLASLFSQAPGLATSFNDIFNDKTTLPAAPPKPAALPDPQSPPSNTPGD